MTVTVPTLPAPTPAAPKDTVAAPTPGTRALLAGGVLAGPLFLATVVVQQAVRDGVDARSQPMSLLSLGEAGWIQIVNFLLCGVLAIGSAFGIRRLLRGRPAGTWGPILVAAYGAALVWGGVFVTDPASGFPAGTPQGAPDPSTWSWHGTLHAFAAPAMGLALVGVCLVFSRRFLRLRRPG
ncbi:hypothetical protein Cme02nite_65040 [Catellatospora methionotrophica]|uniref:DUF998 domain-containing protein n=1 Tax=Catellatospora methionotrophica TaxID=121620 RepID=A0A8J3LF47_9ACTN|nr:DUF998 domain-containing protein [Catellatospora methionotrophica]GIG18172.1 hypothetical protein Cme02nite_65040 [Catellatospora methionotrophica]